MAKANDGIGDLVRGTLSGLVAAWATSQMAAALSSAVQSTTKATTDGEAAQPDYSAHQGDWLLSVDRFMLGSAHSEAVRWEVAAGAGALYGALRGRLPGADAGSGLLFGAGLYLVAGGGEKSARGALPWLLYGATAELAIKALERVSK